VSRTRRLLTAAAMAAAVGLAACGGGAKTFEVAVNAASNVNPGPSGAPRAVLVRVMQLASDEAFRNAEYRAFLKDPKDALGDDLLAAEELLLAPGEQAKIDAPLEEGARHLAVVALYRAPDRSDWKVSVEVEPKRFGALRGGTGYVVTVGERDVVLERD